MLFLQAVATHCFGVSFPYLDFYIAHVIVVVVWSYFCIGEKTSTKWNKSSFKTAFLVFNKVEYCGSKLILWIDIWAAKQTFLCGTAGGQVSIIFSVHTLHLIDFCDTNHLSKAETQQSKAQIGQCMVTSRFSSMIQPKPKVCQFQTVSKRCGSSSWFFPLVFIHLCKSVEN